MLLLGQLYEREFRCYQRIDELLESYNFSKSPEDQAYIFHGIQKINAQLFDLQKQHSEITRSLNEGKARFWVCAVSEALIPLDRKNNPLSYLQEEYSYFVKYLLYLDGISHADSDTIKSLVLKLFSQPKGQELIIALNQFRRDNPQLSIRLEYGECFGVKPMLGCSIIICCKKNFMEDIIHFLPGKQSPVIYDIPFISFGHELIHCLNGLNKKNNRLEDIPSMPADALFHLYDRGIISDREEYETIEEGEISENLLRSEHELPPRGGHLCAKFTDTARMIEIAMLSKFRHGETNFNSWFFPREFSLPFFLGVSKLNLPNSLVQARLPKQAMPRLVFN